MLKLKNVLFKIKMSTTVFLEALNVLYALSDLCTMLKPLYDNKDVPLVFTERLLTVYQKNPYVNGPNMLRFILSGLLVYLFETSSNAIDFNHLPHKLFLKSFAASDSTLCTVWSQVLRIRPTSDVLSHQLTVKRVEAPFEPVVLQNAPLCTNALYIFTQYMTLPEVTTTVMPKVTTTVPPVNASQQVVKQESSSPFSVLFSGCEIKSVVPSSNTPQRPTLTGPNSLLHQTFLHSQRETLLLAFCQRINEEKRLHQSLTNLLTHGYNQEVPSINVGTGTRGLPAVTKQEVYIGPETFDSETANNCFVNSALVSMFMFPSDYVLKQLYETTVKKVHILDIIQPFCYPEEIKRDWNDRNHLVDNISKLGEPMTVEDLYAMNAMVELDYQKKVEIADAFRACYETFQKGARGDPNRIRQRIRRLLTVCKNVVSGVMIENQFGEPDVVFEMFENVFVPPTNLILTETTYLSPSKPPCSSLSPALPTMIVPVGVVHAESQKPSDTLLTYFLQTYSSDDVLDQPNFECNEEKKYNKRVQVLKQAQGTFFCFAVSRSSYEASSEDGELGLDDSKRVIPDSHFKGTNGVQLPLRAVIVTQGGYHYVCYVLNTFTDRWMYFNGGRLLEIGGYQQLLSHNDEEVVYRGTTYIYG